MSALNRVFPSDLRLSRSSCDDVTHDETAEEDVWAECGGYKAEVFLRGSEMLFVFAAEPHRPRHHFRPGRLQHSTYLTFFGFLRSRQRVIERASLMTSSPQWE